MEQIHVYVDTFFNKRPFFQKHKQIMLYFFFGCTAASFDLGVYLVLFNAFGVDPVISTIISIAVATVVGFFLNAFINFKVDDRLFLRFLSYAAVSGVGMCISSGMLYVFVTLYGYDGNIVKIVSLPVIFAVQYLLNCATSFRKKKNNL